MTEEKALFERKVEAAAKVILSQYTPTFVVAMGGNLFSYYKRAAREVARAALLAAEGVK